MKVELHCHTTRYSSCATASPEVLIPALIQAGYDAVYITEHEKAWPAQELADLQGLFPAIRILAGLELSFSPRREHLVILGACDDSYSQCREPADAISQARQRGHLTVLAHPFRWPDGAKVLLEGTMPDAIEYRTCNQDIAAAGIALNTAAKMNLPIVNAGDVHSLEMTNRFWIQTTRPIGQACDIRQIILDGAYSNHTSGD
jgi:hypothetical protein